MLVLDKIYDPNILYVTEIVQKAWENITATTLARFRINAEISRTHLRDCFLIEHGDPHGRGDVKQR